MEPGTAVLLRGVRREYPLGAHTCRALHDVDLEIARGELVVVTGRSGSGKSTLLNIVAGIDRPTAGEVTVAGRSLGALDEDALARFRGERIGLVFQFFQLLPSLTVLENVLLPMDFVGRVPGRERVARAEALLARLGVEDQADKVPSMLSGGQQQRVAIARALANDPELVLADEPTGNLDSETARGVLGLLAELASEGKTVVLVTHEADVASGLGRRPDRVLSLHDGRSHDERPGAHAATGR